MNEMPKDTFIEAYPLPAAADWKFLTILVLSDGKYWRSDGTNWFEDHALATSGLVATGQLGTGTADSTKFLRGDQTWQAVTGGPHASSHAPGGTDDINTSYVSDTEHGALVHTADQPIVSHALSGAKHTGRASLSQIPDGTLAQYLRAGGIGVDPAYAQPLHTELGSVTVDQHHAQLHKAAHLVGGGDAFAKLDVILAAGRYLEGITDPASDSLRLWMNVKDLKWWSNEGTPVLQIAERLANKAVASGYASLDSSTLIPTAQHGTGTADTTTFLRGDRSWAVPPGGGTGASLTRIAGSSGAAGADLTWQRLTANSADITSTTLTVVMTTTGVGVGTWKFKYTLIYQTAATTTGIGLAVNHTGTTGLFSSVWHQVDVAATASTGVGDGITAAAIGGVIGAHAERVKNTATVASVGVDVINSNIMVILEGIIVVTVSGSLELKLKTEVSGSAVRLMADSMLELNKIV